MTTMFIVMKYGDASDTLLMNPNCQCKIFIAYLRAKIPLIQAYETQNEEDGPWMLDLCDEQGNLKGLPERRPLENLSSFFENRMVYIPILVTKTHDGHYRNLVPLIEDVTNDMDKRLKKYLKIKVKGGRHDDYSKSVSPASRGPRKSDHARKDIASPSVPEVSFKREKKNKSASRYK